MAGVAAVLHARNMTMMPAEKVGTEFLAGSHFTIAQDNTAREDSLKSIFKKDYIPWDINSKPPGSKPPRPADLLQKDDRYFNEKLSETKQAYEYRFLEKPELLDSSSKLRKTNFKMDSDLRLDSFQTSHKIDYPPKEGGVQMRGEPKKNPMQSFIPQGDKEKAPDPISDYKDRYRGHDVSMVKPEKVASAHQGGAPTITGDNRQHHFNTTHDDTYRGHFLPRITAYNPPIGTNIPQGDPEKQKNLVTTHQASYPVHDHDLLPYDPDAAGKLRETSFKEKDGLGTWNTYMSTMKDSYLPVEGLCKRSPPTRHRNYSDFPVGDNDPYRNAVNSNMTTNRYYHGNVPETTRPHIVSGAKKRTESQVMFGEPRLNEQYYETTTHSTFQPCDLPGRRARPHFNTKSVVPLDYYANENHSTMYKSDFYDPLQDKMRINSAALEKLKNSHIKAPLGGLRQFSTEHLDQYTPKATELSVVTDPGRLQKSSVPIGTLPK